MPYWLRENCLVAGKLVASREIQQLATESDTIAAGVALSEQLQAGGLVFLHGDLGAGKTTLVRGILQGLGHEGHVRSPTYTLVERYPTSYASVCHYDLYRMADPSVLEFIGAREDLVPENLCLIEWPERGQGWLECQLLDIYLCLLYTSDAADE